MAVIETYEDFVADVKARGCKVLLKEVNTYNNDLTLSVLYAEANGTLIGTWSPVAKGRTMTKSTNWSKSKRTFTKVAI